jgi:aryl-alcohol dehydrogenase-like predicted oxidoreductase
MPMGEDPNRRSGSRRWIMAAVEDSLRRLGTDWIDLYQVHRPDPDTDVDETLSALTDLVQHGKVRYIGSSSYAGSQIVEAQWTARNLRLERFRTEQPPYSMLVRGIELDVLPAALRHGMGILTYGPLSGGWLSGNWTADSSPASPARQRLVVVPRLVPNAADGRPVGERAVVPGVVVVLEPVGQRRGAAV